jgi:hypothetical protein
MKFASIAAAALLMLGAAGVASAAPACHDQGFVNVTDMSFNPKDETVMRGLSAGLQLALEPASFPAEDIAKAHDACRRGEFTVGRDHWEIFGDDKDTPPRWAVGPDRKRIVYLAAMPDPLEAAAWAKKYEADPKTEAKFSGFLYAVVVSDGDGRLVYHVSRVVPDDYHLALLMKAALSGEAAPMAVLNAKTHQVDLSGIEKAASAGSGPAGAAKPSRFKTADGTYFVGLADGSVRHVPSSLVCPAKIDSYARLDMSVMNPADGGRDVFCRFFAEKSWFSVFATRFDGSTLQDVFNGYLKDAQANTPQARILAPPGRVSTDLPMQSAFWLGTEGASQGLWVARKGDWYFEIRATYTPGEEAKAAAFAQKMLDLLARRQARAAPDRSANAHNSVVSMGYRDFTGA